MSRQHIPTFTILPDFTSSSPPLFCLSPLAFSYRSQLSLFFSFFSRSFLSFPSLAKIIQQTSPCFPVNGQRVHSACVNIEWIIYSKYYNSIAEKLWMKSAHGYSISPSRGANTQSTQQKKWRKKSEKRLKRCMETGDDPRRTIECQRNHDVNERNWMNASSYSFPTVTCTATSMPTMLAAVKCSLPVHTIAPTHTAISNHTLLSYYIP